MEREKALIYVKADMRGGFSSVERSLTEALLKLRHESRSPSKLTSAAL